MPKTSAINRIQLGSGTGHKLVGSDPVVSALPTITTPHHEVHEGEYYGTGYLWTTVADNAEANLLIVMNTPNDLHCLVAGAIGGDAFAYVYEDPTFTDAPTDYGTALVERNFNRNYADASQFDSFHTPTILADGNNLVQQFIPGGAGPARFTGGGSASTREEIVLISGKIYLFRLTNKSGGAQPASIEVTGYEHSA